MSERKITVPALAGRKGAGDRIAMVTAYDATIARLLDAAGVDVLLVGDSLGMVVQGRDSTIPVTLDEMVYHTRAVVRGADRALVVADLPFLTYQISPEQAMRSAGELLQRGGCAAVKLEGGAAVAPQISRLVAAGIPVVGHVGLTPQSVHAMGGYRVQGRDDDAANRILADAHAVADAGAFLVVLEGVPALLARRITEAVSIPTIGIGAGPDCDGQVLVCYDLLGMYDAVTPRFVRHFAEVGATIRDAAGAYVAAVRSGEFPAAEHSFGPLEVVDHGGDE